MNDLVDESIEWMDQWFDPEVGLLWNPDRSFEGLPGRSVHMIPQCAWYCLALAHRDGPGDRDRLGAVLDALVATQYRHPGAVWDGTYAKFLEWPTPAVEGAVEWDDYDPNWRQFLGTALTMLLRRYPGHIDAARRDRVAESIAYAVAGEPPERIRPSYTNIALKVAWLDVEWGDRDRGERLAEAVWRRTVAAGAFEEFNSPTYDGISLWGLALWRGESSSPSLRTWGAELEALLWRRISERYHAGLRNMAGPYNRAYGMDMETTFSTLGLWIALSTGADNAPIPDRSTPFTHSHDFCFTPLPALVGTVVPDDVAPTLATFGGEHTVETVLESTHARRSCTAWLGGDVILGAESGTIDWGGWEQHHLATAHWRTPDGPIAWLRVRHPGPSAATADPGVLRVDAEGVSVEVGGVDGVTSLDPGTTALPGLDVSWRRGASSTIEVTPT